MIALLKPILSQLLMVALLINLLVLPFLMIQAIEYMGERIKKMKNHDLP